MDEVEVSSSVAAHKLVLDLAMLEAATLLPWTKALFTVSKTLLDGATTLFNECWGAVKMIEMDMVNHEY